MCRGHIVFPAATVGVCYDREEHEQRFHMSHTEEIMSITTYVEDGLTLIATGEMGIRPRIVIWDADTMQPLYSTK